jgi:hypothetical protein
MAADDHLLHGPREFVPAEGDIRERTIRLGHVVLAVRSIDSVILTVKPRELGPILVGLALIAALAAAYVQYRNLSYVMTGSTFLFIFGVGAAAAVLWPRASVLAIGTDGGRTYYAGANKEFLARLGELIRRKIDTADAGLLADFSARDNELAVGGKTEPPRRV